ncbi:hypothetical protein C0991_002793, partial [Blastosporella zonata]
PVAAPVLAARAPSTMQPPPAKATIFSEPATAAACAPVPPSVPAPVALATKPAADNKAQSPKPLLNKPLIGGLSFSSLDDSDLEEEIPLSKASAKKRMSVLGKRERVPSPAKAQVQPPPEKEITYNGSRRLVDVFPFRFGLMVCLGGFS